MLALATLQRWQDGERRLSGAPAERQHVLERVCEHVYLELRRRLGGSFTVAELVALYDAGTDWCMAVAFDSAPGFTWAWESWIADAAFHRYLSEAADYAGGRVVDRG